MTNQEKLAKVNPEECYKTIEWLWNVYSWQWTDSRAAIINWLKETVEETGILSKVITPQNKTGKWSEVNSQFFGTICECSNCKRWSNIETAFCPHCGVKMEI